MEKLNHAEITRKYREIFDKYYASKEYEGTFDSDFLCGGYARKTTSDGGFEFHKTLEPKDWKKLIKMVSGKDYNFYDVNFKHYGFTNYDEYMKEKERVEKEIGIRED